MNIKIPDYVFPLIIAILMAVMLKPMVLDGLSPQGVDVIASKGQTKQLKEYKNRTGETPLYNPSLFGGMPVYFRIPPKAISIDSLFSYLGGIVSNVFLWYLLGGSGVFFLCRFLGLGQFPSFFGALGFVLYPHYQALWAEGHFMKFRAIMIIPWVCMTSVFFFRKTSIISMGLFALAWGIQIRTQHYQIVFYTALLIFVIGIISLIRWIKDRKWNIILKSATLTLIGIFIALMSASQPLFLAREYLPYSTRGANTINLSEADSKQGGSGGVGLSYATQWSTHPAETGTWILPHFYGGMSGIKYYGDTYPSLKGKTIPGYWGYMPFTQSYEYMGPLILILFILGIISTRKSHLVSGLVGLSIFLVLLSFGHHFEFFYSLFFDYFPFFNKFRAPMMSITVTFFIIILISAFGLEYLMGAEKKDFRQSLWIFGCFCAIGFIIWFLSSGFLFSHVNDSYGEETIRIIKTIRKELLQNDFIRYFLIVGTTAGVIVAFFMNRINSYFMAIFLTGIMIIDLINVQSKKEIKFSDIKKLERKHFKKTSADNFFLSDKEIFRIFPIGKLFGSNQWSYYHQSIGGYSSIKMNGIQEIITNNLYHPMEDGFPINMNIVEMMNVKYLISQTPLYNPSLSLIPEISGTSMYIYQNENFLPRGYFVKNTRVISNVVDRLNFMNSGKFSPGDEAILHDALDLNIDFKGEKSAVLKEFKPGHVRWNLQSSTSSLFVISESYYKPGWKAYLNDMLVPLHKANHIQMALVIPEGQHELKLEFEPESYYQFATLEKIVLYSLYLFIFFHGLYRYSKRMPFLTLLILFC